MKINVILMAFILIAWVAFKSLIIPGTIVPAITSTFIPIKTDCLPADGVCVELSFAGLGSAANQTGESCSGGLFGFADCIQAIAILFIAIVKIIVELIFAIIAFIINIVLLAALFLLVGFSPIEGAPVVINLILVGTFTIGILVVGIGFFPGES